MGYKYLTRTFLTELEAQQFAAMFVEANGKLHHKKWTIALEFDSLADRPVELYADKVFARPPLADRQFTGVPKVRYAKRRPAPAPVTDETSEWDAFCGTECDCTDSCWR